MDPYLFASMLTFSVCLQTRGSLRDQGDLPGLRLKRSRDQPQAPVSPPGRILGCVTTTESGTVTLAMFKLEGKEVPSAPLLSPCVTKDLCENAMMPCSRVDLMDRNSWLGLLQLGE